MSPTVVLTLCEIGLVLLIAAMVMICPRNQRGWGIVGIGAAIATAIIVLFSWYVIPEVSRNIELLQANSRAVVLSPRMLNIGNVPRRAETFSYQLEDGVVYQVISGSRVGPDNDKVFLVREACLRDRLHLIRVKTPIRLQEYFTIVDDVPVATSPLPVGRKDI